MPAIVPVDELLAELAGTYRVLRRDDRVQLQTVSAAGLPPLRTDRHLLMQALRNLVSNALKYTSQGHVRISAELAGGDHVAIQVSDTGEGVAAADLERIFEEWEQGPPPTDAERLGSGLGLPFVRRIAHLLGGELTLTSRRGAGTTATLTVRVAPQAARR
jgi:signal transduction histidine kinase